MKDLISAEVHAGSSAPVLQPGVSQFQGGRLGLQVCVQPLDVALHFCHLVLGLQARARTVRHFTAEELVS